MAFLRRLKQRILGWSFLLLFVLVVYYVTWGRHLYLITAYCNCSVCINVKEYHDGRFASGKKVYWGGVAADRKVPFGTKIELVPLWPADFLVVNDILKNRKDFRVEDRGGLIRGKHIDLFIADDMGGHKTALKWGRRWMRIRMNGEWAE